MKICSMNSIVEGFNRFIESKRAERKIFDNGHVVLHSTITPNPTMKAYKTYESALWFVKDGNKYRVVVVKYCTRVIDGHDDEIKRILEIELSKALFTFATSDKMEEIINGTYTDTYE